MSPSRTAGRPRTAQLSAGTTVVICDRCGYLGQYRSQALADYHHPRHSCTRQQQLTVDAARRTAARLTRAAGRRECTHPRARHQHGTRAAYVADRCRCALCTDANTAEVRGARRSSVAGRPAAYVPAAAARAHLRRLLAAGVALNRVAALSGVGSSTLYELLTTRADGRGPLAKIRPATAHRLLAIDPATAQLDPRTPIGATGTRRRLQALLACGWSVPRLAGLLRRRPDRFGELLTADTVVVTTARAVHALYDDLWDAAPPQTTVSERTQAAAARSDAQKHGWAPPLAWDDIDIDTDRRPLVPIPAPSSGVAEAALTDDPSDIDEVAVDRAVNGPGIDYEQLSPAERDEALRRLTARGLSLREIAEQLHTTARTISRWREDEHARSAA